jgi:hypothetical protein
MSTKILVKNSSRKFLEGQSPCAKKRMRKKCIFGQF